MLHLFNLTWSRTDRHGVTVGGLIADHGSGSLELEAGAVAAKQRGRGRGWGIERVSVGSKM